jgi:flagellar biosynthesis protein FlhB
MTDRNKLLVKCFISGCILGLGLWKSWDCMAEAAEMNLVNQINEKIRNGEWIDGAE